MKETLPANGDANQNYKKLRNFGRTQENNKFRLCGSRDQN